MLRYILHYLLYCIKLNWKWTCKAITILCQNQFNDIVTKHKRREAQSIEEERDNDQHLSMIKSEVIFSTEMPLRTPSDVPLPLYSALLGSSMLDNYFLDYIQIHSGQIANKFKTNRWKTKTTDNSPTRTTKSIEPPTIWKTSITPNSWTLRTYWIYLNNWHSNTLLYTAFLLEESCKLQQH